MPHNMISQNDGWANIAPGAAPSPILYMDTMRATEFSQFYKQHTYSLLRLAAGMTVLDVGCGTGDDVRALSQVVGNTGKVVGIDTSETMISEARARSEPGILSVDFRQADVHHLPFGADSFDRCRADRVFQHLEQPQQALQEMCRVLRPEGLVVISEPDWETLVIDGVALALLQKFVGFICSRIVKNARIGRQLPNLFKAAGLQQVTVTAGAFAITDYTLANKLWGLERNALRAMQANVFTQAEYAEWLTTLQQAGQADRFFGSATGFSVSGQKK
ncbi:MAG: methyltransferase domain-containing protein [Caldilineaceae bacterium]